MDCINDIQKFKSKPTTVTIGTFDGVHIGHQQLLKTLNSKAKETHTISTVLTFFPHPRMILQQDNDLKLINTIREKLNLLESFGVEQVIVYPFDVKFSAMSSEEYVRDVLIGKLNMQTAIVGYDHRFGRHRSATIKELKKFGEKHQFDILEIPAKEIDNFTVSSTKIRLALQKGDISTANNYLGYNYTFLGKVIKGNGIGKTINFPTANIEVEESYKMIPKKGVYAVKGIIDENILYGMMNIGTKPTVDGRFDSIEVYWFNFKSNIYEKNICVEPVKYIRKEKKFDSLETLKAQLEKDKIQIESFLN